MSKKNKTRFSDIKVTIDYGLYLVGFTYQVKIGNNIIAAEVKYPLKPTKNQLKALKKAWYKEMRIFDYKSLYYKKYDIKKGKFLTFS